MMTEQEKARLDLVESIARQALSRAGGATTRSSFQLPVDFYNAPSDLPANRRFHFDDTTIPGFTSIFIGAAAEAPAGGNYTFAVAHDESELAIGAGIGEIALVPPTLFLQLGLFNSGILQNGGFSYTSGNGQPWIESVASDFDLTPGGALVLDATRAQSNTLRFAGTLPGNSTLELPNTIGATWDCDFADADLGAFTLTAFCGGNIVNVPLAGNVLGVRLKVTKSGYLIAMGAPSM